MREAAGVVFVSGRDWGEVLKRRAPREKARIVGVPVKTCERPTEALFGAVKLEKPVGESKRVARDYIRKKLVEDLQ